MSATTQMYMYESSQTFAAHTIVYFPNLNQIISFMRIHKSHDRYLSTPSDIARMNCGLHNKLWRYIQEAAIWDYNWQQWSVVGIKMFKHVVKCCIQ